MIPSWLAIAIVTIILAASSSLVPSSGRRWFQRLRRPSWLKIESAIPLIWTTVFICGAWSAYRVWEQAPGTLQAWWFMAGYLLLEAVTLAYTLAMLQTRRLKVGFIIGLTDVLVGLILTILVVQVDGIAALLLLPYVLWSPIGTYITWEMMRLNPLDV